MGSNYLVNYLINFDKNDVIELKLLSILEKMLSTKGNMAGQLQINNQPSNYYIVNSYILFIL